MTLRQELHYQYRCLRLGWGFLTGRFINCNLQVTYRCNFKCQICDFWKEPHDPADELSLEDWDWQIAINLMGVVKGCKAFLPLVQKSKGKIINIASMAALMQAPGMSNYNVAKAGVVALSESLMVELRQAEVGVHVVCPSFFQTNLLDSFRGPTPNVKAQIGKLLESSPITAADIADYIHQQVAKGEFMILPHEEGRMAWKVKQQNPQAIYDEMALLAEKKRAKSKAV